MDIDKSRQGLIKRLIDEEQERFKILEASDRMLDAQYQNDNITIMTLLSDWLKKSKTDAQKKVLTEAITSFFRISSYVSTMQTISKSSTSKFLTERKAHNKLVSKYSNVKQENEMLKKIIADYESGRL